MKRSDGSALSSAHTVDSAVRFDDAPNEPLAPIPTSAFRDLNEAGQGHFGAYLH